MTTSVIAVQFRADPRQALDALRQVGAGMQGLGRQTAALGRTSGQARADVGNLAAQFQDIGVMLAAGQNPFQLAIQQGSQISQVLGPMGARGAVRALGAAFVSLLNPVTAITIGAIAGGATLLQWLMDTDAEAKSLAETLKDLEAAVGSYASAVNADPAGLAERFHITIDAARELLEVRRELARVDAAAGLRAAQGGITEASGGFADADAIAIQRVLDLYREREAAQAALSRAIAESDGVAQVAAAARLDAVNAELLATRELQEGVLALANVLGVDSVSAAAALAQQLREAAAADTPREMADAYKAAAQSLLDQVGGYQELNGEARVLYGQIVDAYEAALQIAGLDLSTPFSEAATSASTFAEFLRDASANANSMADAMERAAGVRALDGYREYQASRRAGVFADAAGERRSFSEAADRGIFALIRAAEGTAGPGGYNTSLAHGALLPGGQELNLVNMTLRDILAVQRQMLQHPDNRWNSSALGAYQIVGSTLGGPNMDGSGGLIAKLDLSLDQQFTAELQDRLAAELLRGREGQGLGGLRSEWEGLKNVPDATIQRALGAQTIPAQDPEVVRQTAAAREAEARAVEQAQRAYEGLMGSMDPLVAAQQAFARGQAVLDDALARGVISAEEYHAALARLQQRLGEDRVSAALGNILGGAEQATQAMEQLSAASERGAARMAELFTAVATGAMSAREAVVALLLEIAKAAIAGGFQQLAGAGGWMGAAFGAIGNAISGQRAGGGSVWPGGAFLVGERGPEMFLPGRSGAIVPNHLLGSPDRAAGSLSERLSAMIDVRVSVDDDGALRAFVARTAGAAAEMRARVIEGGLRDRVLGIVNHPRDMGR